MSHSPLLFYFYIFTFQNFMLENFCLKFKLSKLNVKLAAANSYNIIFRELKLVLLINYPMQLTVMINRVNER